MAQIPIREYDVKKMFARYAGTEYNGIQIRELCDVSKLKHNKKYVIKPDMLFGKRGKRGMLGVNLDKGEVEVWFKKWYKKEVDIDGVTGTLDVFLAEEVVYIKQEYYLSFSQSRDGDIVYFSENGGVDIEENWGTTKNIVIPVTKELSEDSLSSLVGDSSPLSQPFLQGEKGAEENKLFLLISSLFHFYRTHGFTSLECNPIACDRVGNLHLIDAVAKIDDCEYFLQKNTWSELEYPNSFGWKESEAERYIRELDQQTGASLKLKILNPDAAIWTLFAGGGGSLVMTDSLGALGFSSEIGNYGELSGNPSREFTREYTRVLLKEMLKAKSKQQKYLIIAGAIANFTDIKAGFSGIVDILEELQDELRVQDIQILVRRGGINEEAGLEILRVACKKLNIPARIHGSEAYMTDILQEITL